MKRSLFQQFKVILLILIFSSFLPVSRAQTVWAQVNAKWYFDIGTCMTCDGYVKVEKLKDTLVQGKLCSQLEKTSVTYDYIIKQYDTTQVGKEYLYQSNDTVYRYSNKRFYALYIYNAKPGDSWQIAGRDLKGPCDSVGRVKVDSIGLITLNGNSYRWIATSPVTGTNYGFKGKIVEKIGGFGYMFPDYTNCLADADEGGKFRCYSDVTGWNYSSGIVPNCSFITSVQRSHSPDRQIVLFPNPAENTISLKNYENKQVRILGSTGGLVYSGPTDSQGLITVSALQSGIYVALLEDGQAFRFVKR